MPISPLPVERGQLYSMIALHKNIDLATFSAEYLKPMVDQLYAALPLAAKFDAIPLKIPADLDGEIGWRKNKPFRYVKGYDIGTDSYLVRVDAAYH